MYQPLNRPPESAPARDVRASSVASTEAFHLAMLATALLLGLGAAINAIGLRGSEATAVDGTTNGRADDPVSSEV